MIKRPTARSSASANIHVTLWLTSVATGTLPAAVDKPDRGNGPCCLYHSICVYSGRHVLRVPHPSGIKTGDLSKKLLRCSNTQISHPDHPRMVRMVYLLTDVDPKLPMYVKKAAKWESRPILSVKSGLVGSRPSLALGASDSSTASLPFSAPGKLRDGSKKNDSNT